MLPAILNREERQIHIHVQVSTKTSPQTRQALFYITGLGSPPLAQINET